MSALGSPIAWLAASLAVYAATRHAAWHLAETAPERLPPPAARRVAAWAYLAGVPALALAVRVPESPAQLGLALPEHLAAALGAALVVGALCALGVRAAATPGTWALAGRPLRPSARTAIDAAAAEAGLALHTGFVRSAVLSAGIGLGEGPTGGAAAMVATLALLAIEALLDPGTRHAVLPPARPPARAVRDTAVAAADAAAFALTGTMIATIAARLAARACWAAVRPAPGRAPAADADRQAIEPTVL